jgi:hypothetical protein
MYRVSIETTKLLKKPPGYYALMIFNILNGRPSWHKCKVLYLICLYTEL